MGKTYNITVNEFINSHFIDTEKLYYGKLGLEQLYNVEENFSNALLGAEAFVVSVHKSKSCLLPVYAMRMYNGIKVIMRNNFYDWVLTIMSPKEISIPSDLVYGLNGNNDIKPVYCEGFKSEWVFGFNTENFKNTTVYVSDNLRLFTLLYLLNKEVIAESEKVSENALKSLNFESVKSLMDGYLKRHKGVSLFNELFPRTYSKLTDYNFCTKNNLSIFPKDSEEIYKRIVEFEDLKRVFLTEKISFDWGENFDGYYERLKELE